MKNSLYNLYDKFTPKERFDLVLAAYARNSIDEVDKLHDSCPRKCYEMEDLAFLKRLRKLAKIAHHFNYWHERYMNALGTCAISAMALQEICDTYDEAFDLAQNKTITSNQKAGAKKEKQKKELAELKNICETYEKSHQLNLRALHEAFRLFCVEADINHTYALDYISKLFLCAFPELGGADFAKLKPEIEVVEEYKNHFMELWR